MLLFVKETGQLIEYGEKNAKESVEEMKSASGMDGQEEGKKQGIRHGYELGRGEGPMT